MRIKISSTPRRYLAALNAAPRSLSAGLSHMFHGRAAWACMPAPECFRLESVTVSRYAYRDNKIPAPWPPANPA
jgi:hypothetical protein